MRLPARSIWKHFPLQCIMTAEKVKMEAMDDEDPRRVGRIMPPRHMDTQSTVSVHSPAV